MSAMVRWFARRRLQNEIDPSSPEPVENQFYGGNEHLETFYGESDLETNLFESRDHYVPNQLVEKEKEALYRFRPRKVIVRSSWKTRLVYRQPVTGKLITMQETTGEDEEAIYVHAEEDQILPPSESCPAPPLNAEYFLHLFLKRDERDAVIGDLLERYTGKHHRFGERRAKLWFYSEVMRSLWPLLKRLMAKAGGLIALGEWIRRHVS